MEKINFFKKIYISIIKPKDYYILIRETVIKAILYMMILTLITGIISFIVPAMGYYKFISLMENEINNGFPEFTLKDGILDVKEREPIVISKKNKPTIIIDTSGNTSENVLNKYDKCILILKDRAISKRNRYKIDRATYDFLDGMSLDKKKAQQFIPRLKYVVYLIVFLTPLLIVILNLFLALMISLIGTLINAVLKWPLEYKNIYKISIYSITLPIIIAAILRVTGISISYRYYFYIIIGGVYVMISMTRGLKKMVENT
ncbi:DUF1189 domain-containing protein [Clostridium paridis]|uniref:DUF1189 domain-containing protein n=1 Tax=Clostridium paridis TaxID=2803863 RepID=A0A937FIC5_9CLOT|nr:DUF1189 domain-containing protein [Clostridium paridis]MBL4933610.1 DUF1189 domain-containing protein [Clostridium paridis]